MTLTRAQHQEALKYLLHNVLSLAADGSSPSELSLVHNDVPDLDTFLSLDPEDLAVHQYPVQDTSGNQTTQALKSGGYRPLQRLHEFTHLLIAEKGDDLTLDEWKAVTRAQFLVYCANPRSPPTHITSPAHGELKEWNKSIKREISAYPHLKDITAFDIWKMKFESVIISHGVDKVIDSTYRATTRPEKDIFRKHQDFVFAVLLRVVNYDKGQSIVRTYANL